MTTETRHRARLFAAPELALVRGVSDSFDACLQSDPSARIDVAVARLQHEAYVAALRDAGVGVVALPPEPGHPDGCFIEDTAVILGSSAVSTRPGAASRRGEVARVAEVLARTHSVHAMRAPATLDGGDVLRAGDVLFVGLSARTNREGLDALSEAAALEGLAVTPVEVRGGLHLKSACTLASATQVVYDQNALDPASLSAFRSAGLECIEAEEPVGANVLALGGVVLVSAAAPRTAARLVGAGLEVRAVRVGEFHKGDGALTCLSLRIPRAETWCT